MKVAAAVKDGKLSDTIAHSTEVLIVTEEDGKPIARETIALGKEGITSVLFQLSQQNIDVLLAGEVGTALQTTLRMLGMHVLPGCTGDAIECIAGYLAGEEVGDVSKIVIPEEDEDDPMNCIHDCAKCMAECHDRPAMQQ
ncbi:MAG: hypothetical protein Q4D42_01870 [Eubacteriales bacterium]|nr:hypothetical protein [Eubacteriales bacterium]